MLTIIRKPALCGEKNSERKYACMKRYERGGL